MARNTYIALTKGFSPEGHQIAAGQKFATDVDMSKATWVKPVTDKPAKKAEAKPAKEDAKKEDE